MTHDLVVRSRSGGPCQPHGMTTNTQRYVAVPQARHRLNKVPEVTVCFWVIKILCTTVGETAADFLRRI